MKSLVNNSLSLSLEFGLWVCFTLAVQRGDKAIKSDH